MNDRRLSLSLGDRLLAEQSAQYFLAASTSNKEGYSVEQGWKNDEQRKKTLTISFAAEIGVANKLKQQWNGVNSAKRVADVGNNIEVRWTTTNFAIVTDKDRDSDLLFLVKGQAIDDLYIAGFIPIKMAKVQAYRLDRAGQTVSYWVPVGKLYTYLPENAAVKRFIDTYSRLV